MFIITTFIINTDCKKEFQTVEEHSISPLEEHLGVTASGYQQKREHLDSQGDSERVCCISKLAGFIITIDLRFNPLPDDKF